MQNSCSTFSMMIGIQLLYLHLDDDIKIFFQEKRTQLLVETPSIKTIQLQLEKKKQLKRVHESSDLKAEAVSIIFF